jgi:hypothetical protein
VDDVLSDACPLLVDNTPYSLSPSHALGKCVDDGGLSVAEGNAMILFDCKDELEQSFWAVAQPEGYFAFRSALSGLCLQARGSSTAEGTAIEQRACDYAPAQLWKPSRVDDSVMQLSNKLSALLLDVAGDNATNDSQPIVQSKSDAEAPDMRWRLRRRATAAYFTLAPDDDRLRYLQHRGSEITLAAEDAESAHWRVVPGLADASCVSFQSRDEPGRYLRHASFRIWADLNDGSSLFAFDATFRYKNPFAGSAPFTHAIESLNYSGKFWLRRDAVVALSSRDDASTFDRGATWWLAAR